MHFMLSIIVPTTNFKLNKSGIHYALFARYILTLMKLESALVEAFLGGILEAVTGIYSGQPGFLWTTPRIQSNPRQEL